ncbi:MAG TPA: glutathione S-transferase family protein [Alphaproteobacteria bacterium]
MYRLYWSPGSASMAPHVLLEELGVPYELSRVELKKPREAAYLKMNPWGRVPTLVADGQAIHEAAAICMHLADRHPERGLAPAPASAERALYYQWLLFLADTLQPAFRRVYRPSSFIDDPAQQAAIKEKGLQEVAAIWARLDELLAGKTYLAGERFSAADIYFHMLYTWDVDMAALGRRHRNLSRIFEGIHARPAVARVAELNM